MTADNGTPTSQSEDRVDDLDQESNNASIGQRRRGSRRGRTTRAMEAILWRNLPLAAKLNLAIAILVIAAVASVTWLGIERERASFRAELEQQAELLIQSLSASLSDLLYFQNLSRLSELALRLRENHILTEAEFFDPAGRLVASSRQTEGSANFELSPLGLELTSGATDDIYFDWQTDELTVGKKVAMSGQTVGAMSLRLPTARLEAKVAAVRNRGLMVAGIAGLVGILVASRISRSVTRPLKTLLERTRQVAEGDLSTKVSDEAGSQDSRDEIGLLQQATAHMVDYLREMARIADRIAEADLSVDVALRSENDFFGRSFQKMSRNLRGILGAVKASANLVATSAEDIATSSAVIREGAENQNRSTQQVSSSMTAIAGQIDSIARSTQDLATQVTTTSSSIELMSSAIQQGSQESEVLLESVQETLATLEQASATMEAITTMVNGVNEVAVAAAEVADTGRHELATLIEAIAEAGRDIAGVVTIIEDVADQTNLLSLNAAIEAAHAGDAGAGFAVVAREIRDLAERSMSSIRDISEIVERVQDTTQNASRVTDLILNRITSSTNKARDLIGEVRTAVEEQSTGNRRVLATASEMHRISRQLASAADEQASAARSIVQAIDRMSHGTHAVAEATGEQKRNGEVVVRSVDKVASVSREHFESTKSLLDRTASLSHEAERLHEIAERFTF